MAARGLYYYMWAFTSCGNWGPLSLWLDSPVAQALERKVSSCGTQALCCFPACGIFLDWGLNPCLLYWQADSLPLSHQGSP